MSDAVATVTPGAGENIDVESLTVGTATVLRQRVQVAGAGASELVRVLNAAPAGTEYGLVTRSIPSGTQAVSVASLPLPAGAATDASLGTDGAASPAIPGTGVRGWLRSIYDTLKGTLVTDPVDRAARLLGHVTVDNLPVTQPVSGTVGVSGNVDVTPTTPAANDYLPVRLTDGAAFYTAGAGGGGGGAVTVVDGADVAQGTTTDAAWASGAGTLVALLKATVNAIKATLTADITDRAARLLGHVTVDNASIPVTGTFWQATQPISGTVTGNQGTANTAANAWPAKVTDGTNVAAVKAASTAAVAADPAMVVAVSPNNTVTVTNGAVFTLTNIANTAGSAAAAAAMQGLVVSLSPNSPLVGLKPFTALGFYAVSGDTGTYGGLAANTPLFSFRWGDATRFAVILKVEVMVFTTVAASTAGITERQLIVARSFSASDTGGTALTPTLSNQKRRTSFGTSLATDIRIGNPLTAGTRTLDANPMSRALGWSALNHTGPIIGGHGAGPTSAVWSTAGSEPIKLLDAADGQDHPIVLAQNEGIIVRLGVAQPTGSTQETWVNVVWGEVASY